MTTRAADSVHARVFDGELVILDLAQGEYFALDALGTCLWEGLTEGRTIGELASLVAKDYDVTEDVVLRDFTALRDELIRRGLLVEES